MARDTKDQIINDHEHHQEGSEPAKPEDIGLKVASSKGKTEEKGKQLGESEGIYKSDTSKNNRG
jgi:hypothetical protein